MSKELLERIVEYLLYDLVLPEEDPDLEEFIDIFSDMPDVCRDYDLWDLCSRSPIVNNAILDAFPELLSEDHIDNNFGLVNGTLDTFNIESFIDKVDSQGSLHTVRIDGDLCYVIVVRPLGHELYELCIVEEDISNTKRRLPIEEQEFSREDLIKYLNSFIQGEEDVVLEDMDGDSMDRLKRRVSCDCEVHYGENKNSYHIETFDNVEDARKFRAEKLDEYPFVTMECDFSDEDSLFESKESLSLIDTVVSKLNNALEEMADDYGYDKDNVVDEIGFGHMVGNSEVFMLPDFDAVGYSVEKLNKMINKFGASKVVKVLLDGEKIEEDEVMLENIFESNFEEDSLYESLEDIENAEVIAKIEELATACSERFLMNKDLIIDDMVREYESLPENQIDEFNNQLLAVNIDQYLEMMRERIDANPVEASAFEADIMLEDLLHEDRVSWLEPIYDSRKSFYKKAKEEYEDGGRINLLSYGTLVAYIEDGKAYLTDYWNYSPTTLRHVKEFLKQHDFKAGTSKEIYDMYNPENGTEHSLDVELESIEELQESVLTEAKVDEVQGKFYSDIELDTVRKLAFADPTSKPKKDATGKYFKWIMEMYKKDKGILDRLGELTSALDLYRDPANAKRIPDDKKDINRIKSLDELLEIVKEQDLSTNAVHAEASQIDGAEFIGANSEWEIWRPTTFEAAQKLGHIGITSQRDPYPAWCTNGGRNGDRFTDTYFNSYTREDGKLLIFFKISKPEEKYQVALYGNNNVREIEDADNNGYKGLGNSIQAFKSFIIDNNLLELALNSNYLKDSNGVAQASQAIRYLNGEPVVYTGGILFDDDPSIAAAVKTVEISPDVTSISSGAFSRCSNLETLTIPDTITEIRDRAFERSGIREITIPQGVTEIGFKTFANCENLTTVNLPDSITSIEQSAFYGCVNLSNINIPEGVARISQGAFEECKNLSNITLPQGVTEIQTKAFAGSGIREISIPGSVTTFGSNLFENCESLETVRFEEGITTVQGAYLFRRCANLTSLYLPKSFRSFLVENVFRDCGANRLKVYIEVKDDGKLGITLKSTDSQFLMSGGRIVRLRNGEPVEGETRANVVTNANRPAQTREALGESYKKAQTQEVIEDYYDAEDELPVF